MTARQTTGSLARDAFVCCNPTNADDDEKVARALRPSTHIHRHAGLCKSAEARRSMDHALVLTTCLRQVSTTEGYASRRILHAGIKSRWPLAEPHKLSHDSSTHNYKLDMTREREIATRLRISFCCVAFNQLATGHYALRPTSLALPLSALRTTDAAFGPVRERQQTRFDGRW